jgi:hypothetical protein
MWPHHLSGKLLGGIVTGGLVLAVAHISAPSDGRAFSARTDQPVAAGLIVHVQAGGTKLTGAWVSKSGEQFEVTHADETVEMTFSGPTPTSRKGKISGSFDGTVFAGAYEATEGSTTDRGVVRFLRNPNGTLEGSWRSLVTGRQGSWSLTKK